MPTSLQKAHEYLDMLEADRRTALALSEQKAEEARLIKARQEGFRAAMEMLAGETSGSSAGSEPRGPGRQRVRRPIRLMILRELSFSGQTMTATQIAKAIDYNSRSNENGSELHGSDRPRSSEWSGPVDDRHRAMAQLNEHAVTGGNGKSPQMAGAESNG